MRQLMAALLVISALLLGAVILGRCTAGGNTASKAAPQPADVALAPAATAAPDSAAAASGSAPAAIQILLVGPETVQIGQAAQNVAVTISGVQQLGELSLEIATGAPNLVVVDNDTDTPGIQVAPAALPSGASLAQLEVDASGILRFRVQNYKLEAPTAQNLLLFQVRGVQAGIAGVLLQKASATAPGGDALTLDADAVLMLEVRPAGAATTPSAPTAAAPSSGGSAGPTGVPGTIQSGIYYRIQRGQNLFRLSQTFNVSVEALAQANGITDVRRIPTGMLLRIPVASPKGQAVYLVGTGETLYGIAGSLGMTVEQIAHLNAIAPPYPISVGMYLMLIP